jgi:hypothetical protein
MPMKRSGRGWMTTARACAAHEDAAEAIAGEA